MKSQLLSRTPSFAQNVLKQSGGDNNLALIIGRYTPGHDIAKKCKGHKSIVTTCRRIIDSMNVTTVDVKFGPLSDPATDHGVPWAMATRKFLTFHSIFMQRLD